MKNVETKVDNGVLIIKVQLNKTFGPSRSGKTIIIASTEGNASIDQSGERIYLGLNVYKHAPR